jgi:acyl-coenzyme A synthetase/AMP-(fatty) acid ligase
MIFEIEKKPINDIAAKDDMGNEFSYGDLTEFSSKLSKIVPDRTLVALLVSSDIFDMQMYIACLSNKLVPLMIDAELSDENLFELLDNYKPKYVWSSNGRNLGDTYKQVVYEGNGKVLLQSNADEFPIFDQLGLLLTTSGSTGSPKFVRLSYENVSSNAASIVEYLSLDKTERAITTLPMYYTYGLSIINSHLLAGATVFFTRHPITSKLFWDFFEEVEATSFGGVPFTYDMLAKIGYFSKDLPSLRYSTQAGGKLPADLQKKFSEHAKAQGKRFIVMYGQTEATARMSYLPWENALSKLGSIGIAIPGGKFSIIDTDGSSVEEHDIAGELVYKGPNVSLGYATEGADLIKGDENNGVLETGDMAKRDSDGYYYITGRKKRFLKMLGSRVNLDEVEQKIIAEFGIECVCSGVDDEMRVYITDEEYSKQVKAYLVNSINLFVKSIKVIVIDEIPRNDSGKVLYTQLDDIIN